MINSCCVTPIIWEADMGRVGPWEVSAVVSDRGNDLPDWSLHARL